VTTDQYDYRHVAIECMLLQRVRLQYIENIKMA